MLVTHLAERTGPANVDGDRKVCLLGGGPDVVILGCVQHLVANGLLKQHQTSDRNAVEGACLAALEQWAEGPGAHFNGWIGSTVGRYGSTAPVPGGLGLALELWRLGTECVALRLIC